MNKITNKIKILNFGLSIIFVKIDNKSWYYILQQKNYTNLFSKGIIPIDNEITNVNIKKILNGIIFDCNYDEMTIFSKSLYNKLVYLVKYENI
jgi:hypothetical protein